MTKKSFKQNPALQFLTATEENTEEQKQPVEAVLELEPNAQEVKVSLPQPEEKLPEKAHTIEKAPEGYKLNPLYVETKSRRLQLVLQPSLYEKVKNKAQANKLSVNEYIHQILEEATREEF